MNTGFYKDLDTNFELACEMSERDFAHEDLLELLQNGNIPEKQIAALKISKLNNKEEAKILMDNLTGCDGKIREAVALKINQILFDNNSLLYFFTQHAYTPFADATIDINGNICRLVIDSVSVLKADKEFADKYVEKLFLFISETFNELDKFIFRDKKYVINKQLFKLYWCLEALKLFVQEIPVQKLLPVLERASSEKEYTIREKVAQILILLDNPQYDNLKTSLKSDDNYYVREVFKL
ncbi:MAG: hypothetical protein E7Z92_03005 [Cyanobacteria bacterium SIG31]|nr:hypothetical protein [Cyanobacteria bacterium SIG31]